MEEASLDPANHRRQAREISRAAQGQEQGRVLTEESGWSRGGLSRGTAT